MAEFTHLLITRFNLSDDRWIRDKNKQLVRTDEWVEKRMEIFTSYCFPSILNQKVKNIKWLVYFHPKTDSKYISTIMNLEKQHEFFIPRFSFKDKNTFLNRVSEDIISFIDDNSTYLISTRLDNDDCLHQDALISLQSMFNFQNYQVINLQSGYCLQIEPNFVLTQRETTKGPFVSLIEKIHPVNKIKTVYSKKHDQFIMDDSVIQMSDISYWIQIIHNNNFGNTLKGNIVLNHDKLKGFNIRIFNISFIGSLKYILKKLISANKLI